jgi:predicted dehydrogenase
MTKGSREAAERWPTISLVGSGAIAQTFYLPTLRRYVPILQRLILVDSDSERAKKVAEQFQIANYFTDYRDVVHSVDGVIIAVPHHLHYSISKEFLAAGVHVLCEKPLAETGTEARDMIRLAEENEVTISVNNTRRLFPSYLKVKQMLSCGEIGNPVSITYLDGGEFSWPTASGFYFDSKLSRKGVLLDIGAHAVDLICWWLGGKPRLVSSENDSFGGCEAVASLILDYRGCRSEIRLSRLSRLPNRFRIRGDQGTIEGGVYDWKSVIVTKNGVGRKVFKVHSPENELLDFGRTLVANFLNVLRKEGKPLIPAGEVLASIELLEEAYSKARRFPMPWYEGSTLFQRR